jgi:hypothetical protein
MPQLVTRLIRLPWLPVTRDMKLFVNLQGRILPCIEMLPQSAQSRSDSGLMVDHNQAKAHPC